MNMATWPLIFPLLYLDFKQLLEAVMYKNIISVKQAMSQKSRLRRLMRAARVRNHIFTGSSTDWNGRGRAAACRRQPRWQPRLSEDVLLLQLLKHGQQRGKQSDRFAGSVSEIPARFCKRQLQKNSKCCARALAARWSGIGGGRVEVEAHLLTITSRRAFPIPRPSHPRLPSFPLPLLCQECNSLVFPPGEVLELLRQSGTSCQVKSGLRLLVSADRTGSPTISRCCCSAAGELDGFSFPTHTIQHFQIYTPI